MIPNSALNLAYWPMVAASYLYLCMLFFLRVALCGKHNFVLIHALSLLETDLYYVLLVTKESIKDRAGLDVTRP